MKTFWTQGWDQAQLSSLPFGIIYPLKNVLSRSRAHPSSGDSMQSGSRLLENFAEGLIAWAGELKAELAAFGLEFLQLATCAYLVGKTLGPRTTQTVLSCGMPPQLGPISS